MALQKKLINKYRRPAAQEVDAYCVIRVTEYDADSRLCTFRLEAYDGPCTKAVRASRQMLPFNRDARLETATGELFDAYFSVEAMAGSNLLKQAYLCATRSIVINGEETNEWHGLPEV